MSQGEVIKYLRKKGRLVDIQELLTNVPANRACISRSCKKLRETGEVRFKTKKEGSYTKYFYCL